MGICNCMSFINLANDPINRANRLCTKGILSKKYLAWIPLSQPLVSHWYILPENKTQLHLNSMNLKILCYNGLYNLYDFTVPYKSSDFLLFHLIESNQRYCSTRICSHACINYSWNHSTWARHSQLLKNHYWKCVSYLTDVKRWKAYIKSIVACQRFNRLRPTFRLATPRSYLL